MENAFIAAGLTAILAAVVGGGLKAFGIEVPILASGLRQLLLGIIGVALLLIGMKIIPIPASSSDAHKLAVNITGWSSPEIINSGEGTTIHVSAITEAGTALPGANVYIRDPGEGKFSLSGSNAVEGMTDDRGQFNAGWAPTRDSQGTGITLHEMQAKVTKDGQILGMVAISVRVRH